MTIAMSADLEYWTVDEAIDYIPDHESELRRAVDLLPAPVYMNNKPIAYIAEIWQTLSIECQRALNRI